MFGLLNVNKPAGATSRDVVNRVQRLLRKIAQESGERQAKVGHAGTLDPLATGVLVLCVGSATTLIEHVQRQPKRYRGTFLLGRRSPSDDIEMEPEPLADAPVPSRDQIAAALPALTGTISQVPPAYSALRVDGKKAYKLARAGAAPEMKPRPVVVHELSVVRYEYPELELDIRCGSGTYIRAIGRDLAASLGTAAVMSALVRTEIGPFHLDGALDPKRLDAASLAAGLAPAGLAVADLPRLELSDADVRELRHGRFLPRPDHVSADLLAGFEPDGRLAALLKPRGRDQLQPTRVFG